MSPGRAFASCVRQSSWLHPALSAIRVTVFLPRASPSSSGCTGLFWSVPTQDLTIDCRAGDGRSGLANRVSGRLFGEVVEGVAQLAADFLERGLGLG